MSKQMCEICHEETDFKRVEKIEEVEIRGLSFTVTHEYDKCLECNELFEPIEDIDKNIKEEYRIYREKAGYLQPEEIKQIRSKYEMTMREFAAVLGIGYSTLSNIENGALQNDYQNTLFELASSPSAIYKHIKKRKEYIAEPINDNVIQAIEMACINEEPHLSDLRKRIDKTIDDVNEKTFYLTRQMNWVEHEINQSIKETKITGEKVREATWTKTLGNILTQN